MVTLHKDLHLTTEFLAFLRAGTYSQILFEGAVAHLGLSIISPGYLETPHKVFDKLDVWMRDLADGMPVFNTTWTSPDTFESINAMAFMKELKKDILWLSPIVDRALQTPNLVEDRESTKILAASVLRSAAHRLSYVETLQDLFIKLRAPERAQQSAAEIADAKGFMQNAQVIVDIFESDAPYDATLCERLRLEAALVPSDLRASAHDARVLLNIYAKDFSFELAEIPLEEAQPWIDSRIPAVAAGYWHAYRFTPQDYMRWASVGIRAAPLAAYWRRARFDPEDAIQWIQHGLPPMVAVEWARAGFDAGRAVAMMQRGITDPRQAPKSGREE